MLMTSLIDAIVSIITLGQVFSTTHDKMQDTLCNTHAENKPQGNVLNINILF